MYFSQLSIICENFANRSDLVQIARYFCLPPDEFVSWLHTMNYVRNLCAHHARLWNRDFHIEPAVLKKSKNNVWLSNPTAYNRKRIYYFLCMVNYMLQTINPTSHFAKRLKHLLHEFRNVIFLDAMDFPKDWKKDPMWRRKKIFGIIWFFRKSFINLRIITNEPLRRVARQHTWGAFIFFISSHHKTVLCVAKSHNLALKKGEGAVSKPIRLRLLFECAQPRNLLPDRWAKE